MVNSETALIFKPYIDSAFEKVLNNPPPPRTISTEETDVSGNNDEGKSAANSDKSPSDILKEAKPLYESGKFEAALSLFVSIKSTREDFLWGKLACLIMLRKFHAAFSTFTLLKETIESSSSSGDSMWAGKMTWLLHWGIFVFLYTSPVTLEGKNYFTDFLIQNVNLIQSHAPHLLRYVIVSSALSRSRRRDVIKILQQDSPIFSNDPVFKLAVAVYASFDFSEMRKWFRESRASIKNDFFLCGYEAEFCEYFRRAIIDNAINCHTSFSVSWITDLLDFGADSSLEWIENHISRLSHVTVSGEAKDRVTIERTSNPNAINNAFTLKKEVYERFKSLSLSIETTEKFLADSKQ